MNDNRPPMPFDERELLEWLQREVDLIRAEERRDKMLLAGIAALVVFVAACAAYTIYVNGGLGA